MEMVQLPFFVTKKMDELESPSTEAKSLTPIKEILPLEWPSTYERRSFYKGKSKISKTNPISIEKYKNLITKS